MATNPAPADLLATTEVTASPLVPLQNGATPAATPSAPEAGTGSVSPEKIVDTGDPDIPGESQVQATGVGTDGETQVWEARYAMKNFLGRLIVWGGLGLAWIAGAIYTWGFGHTNWQAAAIVTGLALAIAWIMLARRMILARYGHYYRLTNRRVFVSTGLFNRRRDQMELLRVQDVYTRQSLSQRWLSLGTVVIVSSEQHFPVLYLSGVEDPKAVMDLVWHHARAERDRRSVKVDQI